MLRDLGELLLGEFAWLAQHGVWNADLAEVVHAAASVDQLHLFGIEPSGAREQPGELRHTAGMSTRIRILHFHDIHHEEQLFLESLQNFEFLRCKAGQHVGHAGRLLQALFVTPITA